MNESAHREPQGFSANTGWISLGGRSRSVFVPVAPPAAQRYSLQFYIHRPIKRALAELKLKCFGATHAFLVDWPVAEDFMQLVFQLGKRRTLMDVVPKSFYVAFRKGTTGPLQKDSALVVSEEGAGLLFVKTACTESADPMIGREAGALSRLAQIPSMRNRVPRLEAFGRGPGGYSYLATSVAVGRLEELPFGSAHLAFLHDLGNATAIWQRFRDAPLVRGLAEKAQRLATVIRSPSVSQVVLDATNEARELAGSTELPMVLTHRDFVPWNMTTSSDGLYVFDWEYAHELGNPLSDYFHYRLLPRALSGWRVAALDMRFMRMLIDEGNVVAAALHSTAVWHPHTVAALLLAHVVDLLLMYVEACGRLVLEDPVQRACVEMLGQRMKWVS